MSEAVRGTGYLGSYPAVGTSQAMLAMARPEAHGVPVRALPDGETGARGNWIQGTVAGMVKELAPVIYIARPGENTRYDNVDILGVRDEARFTVASLDHVLKYANDASKAHNALEFLKSADEVREDMPLLVGIPAPFDLTSPFGFAMEGGKLKFLDVITAAIVNQVKYLDQRMQGLPEPDRAIIQLEAPVSMAASAEHPYWPVSLSTPDIATSLTDAVGEFPEGTEVNVHLCNGDLGGEGNPVLMDTGTALGVRFARLLLRNWPKDRPLTRLHLPMSHGQHHPPSLDAAKYDALIELQGALPEGAQLAAGFAHTGQTLDEQKELLDIIESRYGEPVDVYYHCGLGRLSPTQAEAVIDRQIALAKS